jgi:hypothetical protein
MCASSSPKRSLKKRARIAVIELKAVIATA